LGSNIKGRTYTEDVWEQGTEENISPKRDEMVGGWRKLNNEEPFDKYN
jgi:hypothetical protein